MIIVALITICYGVYELFNNISKDDIFLILFPFILILFGIACIVNVLKKDSVLKGKYSISEGYVEKTFYDESRNVCKLSIKGLKGIIIIQNNFTVGENVYVVYYKDKALICYSKNVYYL